MTQTALVMTIVKPESSEILLKYYKLRLILIKNFYSRQQTRKLQMQVFIFPAHSRFFHVINDLFFSLSVRVQCSVCD